MDAGTITAIVTAVTTLIGGIATFIYKVRGRSWREIFKSVIEGKSQEVQDLVNVVKEQSKVVGNIVEKEIEKKKPIEK